MTDAKKEGYAWAESGRSEYDVRAVVDWCTLEIPETITREFLASEAAAFERLRAAFDDDEELERVQAASEWREAWLDGVIAFYHEAIA